MKILVIGCNGQLGYDMVSFYKTKGYNTYGVDLPEIDITDPASVKNTINKITPDTIINCAAYTAVDECENNQKTAYSINAEGVVNIAHAAHSMNATVVHFSTDYVFDGLKGCPYIESDKTNPLSVYGKSKLEGEKQLSSITDKYFIFRIAWLYGNHGKNFVKTIYHLALSKLKKNQPLKVVNDQFGTPTYTKSICNQIDSVIRTDNFGIYHCTNEGECSWFDFANYITKHLNLNIEIIPCTTTEFPRPAPRPPYSVLENNHLKSLGLNCMPLWKEAFKTFIEEIEENGL